MQDSEPPEAVPPISPEESVVRDDLKVAVPYGPARYRRHHKSAPFEPSSQLHRLPDSRIEDFSDMMNEVVPRLMEGLIEGSDNSNEESNGPDVTLSSPRMAGHKREASKEAVSQPSVSKPRIEDPDEELLCQLDVPHGDQKSIVECLMANFIQKKLQKELPPTGNPTELQDKIDKAKKTEWETLSGKNAVRTLTGVRAKHAKEKQSHRFIGSRYVITEKKEEEEEDVRIKARWCLQGHLDPNFSEKVASGSCHSPTLSQLSRALILQIIVSNKWVMCLGDIKGAFLEAGPLNPKYTPFVRQANPGRNSRNPSR